MNQSEVDKKVTTGTGIFDAIGSASIIGLHMVSGIIVGGGLGYGLDHWLDTFPWCAGIGLILGIVAGFRNVWIDTQRLIRKEGTQNAKNRP